MKDILRAVHPIEKPVNGFLSPADARYNHLVYYDRSIVENVLCVNVFYMVSDECKVEVE